MQASKQKAKQILSLFRGEIQSDPTISQETYDPLEIQRLSKMVLNEVPGFKVTEQLIKALLDCGRIAEAEEYLAQITIEGDGKQLLKGMVKEYQKDYGAAISIYILILAESCNNIASKRLALCFLAAGKMDKALEVLVDHVDTFMNDTEAYMLLFELYLQKGWYEQAKFCLEELILLRPRDHLYLLKYGELLFAMGDYAVALKYYCASLELVETAHGWYGVLVVCDNLLSTKESIDHEVDWTNIRKLLDLATNQLRAEYKDTSLSLFMNQWLE
jgi:tetratricopeptide (TPR) repeat protein